MSLRKLYVSLFFACSLGAVGAGALHAQETRSTLTGFVADSSGARIPNAAVTITDTDTGVVTNAKANDTGVYTVPFLQPGHYQVVATASGFKTYTHSGLLLQTEQTVTENIMLQ